MIRVRLPFFRHEERTPEWIMAVVTLCWGFAAILDTLLVVPRHMMESPFFAPLTYWMGQLGWGVFALAVGITRLAFLMINGSRPRGSTTLRAIGAGLSAMFWLGFVAGAISLPWSSGAVFTYGGLCAFDLTSLFRAAREIFPAYSQARMSDGGK